MAYGTFRGGEVFQPGQGGKPVPGPLVISPGQTIEIRTDSKYLKDMAETWMKGWKKKGWKKKGGEIKNLDLVKELDGLLAQHTVQWAWVRGHNGELGNERADALTNVAMDCLAMGVSPEGTQRLDKPPFPVEMA